MSIRGAVRKSIRLSKLLCNLTYRYYTLNRRVVPGLFVLGPPRSGTSSLHYYIAQHPCYHRAMLKELQYDPEARPIGDLMWLYRELPERLRKPVFRGVVQRLYFRGGARGYRKLFPLESVMEATRQQFGNAVTADFTVLGLYASATTDEFPYSLASEDTKFIAILRNPADFLFSIYALQRKFNREWSEYKDSNRNVSFDRFIHQPLDHLPDAGLVHRTRMEMEKWRPLFEERSFFDRDHFSLTTFLVSYVVFVKHWASIVPDGRFLILSFNDLSQKTTETMSTVFDFLELPGFAVPNTKIVNANVVSDRTIPPETAAYINQVCKPYNEELYEFLGRDLGWN